MVVIDATILMLFFRPDVPRVSGPDGTPILLAKERIQNLIKQIEKAREKVIVPTPVLSEILVRAEKPEISQQIIDGLNAYSVFRIESFGPRAAVELAAMSRRALIAGNKKGDSKAPWQKIKVDRQIVAIAKVVGAGVIYSDDRDLAKIAAKVDIETKGLNDLEVPPEAKQGSFQFDLHKKPEDPPAKPPPDDQDERGRRG